MEEKICCPTFDPDSWNETERTWNEKKFVKDRVRSIFHIPINFGKVMVRNMEKIERAGVKPGDDDVIVLSDENSLWGSDVYISVTGDVPDAEVVAISGTFQCKVFEGPYGQMRNWIGQMKDHVASRGQRMSRLLFYYTTCPRCAKKYGKNYVVLLAQTGA